jgi:hypothetical protein
LTEFVWGDGGVLLLTLTIAAVSCVARVLIKEAVQHFE